MSFKIQIPLSAPKEVTFCGFFFYAKNAADAQKVSTADLPGRVVSVYICFISSVSAFALFAVFPKQQYTGNYIRNKLIKERKYSYTDSRIYYSTIT